MGKQEKLIIKDLTPEARRGRAIGVGYQGRYGKARKTYNKRPDPRSRKANGREISHNKNG
jgi:hypothetical protein